MQMYMYVHTGIKIFSPLAIDSYVCVTIKWHVCTVSMMIIDHDGDKMNIHIGIQHFLLVKIFPTHRQNFVPYGMWQN